MSGSGRYFISLTDKHDNWLAHVVKSGDGHDELEFFRPKSATERTDLLCDWIEQYVPFKSMLAFKEEFHFGGGGQTPREELARIRNYCDELLCHAFLLDRDQVNEQSIGS